MCLGIPGRVICLLDGYHGQLALVDVAGAERKVNIGMLEDQDLAAGDWVVIHMGFAVERVSEGGAEEAMAGLELVGRPRETPTRVARIRRRFEVQGLVQGVGFRYTTKAVACGFDVTGTVRNLPDGRVAVIVEGDRGELHEFRKAIQDSEVGRFIRHEEIHWLDAKNEFKGFEIVR